MTSKQLHIIGLGNITRLDDGVAIQIINELEKKQLPSGVKVTDLGTGGVDIALHLDGWNYGIIIDAVKTDFLQPGELLEAEITDYNLPEIKGLSSTHGFDAITSLKLAFSIDDIQLPKEILLIGIQIETMDGYGTELSNKVQNAIPLVISKIEEKITDIIK
ncbi:MAG: hydrogenase maturation protease [Asgard group archaeon]|nr:hydrogenase maturation protease [Asgard group archaeon]